MTNEDLRFRITTWPEGPILEIPVERFSAFLHEDGSITWYPLGDIYAQLQPEVVLRDLQGLDLFDDPPAVVDFVRKHGWLPRRFELFGWSAPDLEEPMARSTISNHILDVALYLRTIRAMTNHWLDHLEGKDVGEAWLAESADAPTLVPRYPAAPWEMFAQGMSAGLDAYRVRVEYTVNFEDWSFTRHGPRPDLFSALCLQLFNIMSEDLPVRHCANETCGRRFFRQLGRAEYGQYRTEGVRFCSRGCAKAQTQRQYRRRNRKGQQ